MPYGVSVLTSVNVHAQGGDGLGTCLVITTKGHPFVRKPSGVISGEDVVVVYILFFLSPIMLDYETGPCILRA